MPPKLFDDADLETTSSAIRQLFQDLGGNVATRELALAVIQRGILTSDELQRLTIRSVQQLCRQALSAETAARVPFAQPTGDGKHDPWLQLELFTYDRFCGLIDRRAKSLNDDHEKLRRLRDWGLQKYGQAPDIPQFVELEATR